MMKIYSMLFSGLSWNNGGLYPGKPTCEFITQRNRTIFDVPSE